MDGVVMGKMIHKYTKTHPFGSAWQTSWGMAIRLNTVDMSHHTIYSHKRELAIVIDFAKSLVVHRQGFLPVNKNDGGIPLTRIIIVHSFCLTSRHQPQPPTTVNG